MERAVDTLETDNGASAGAASAYVWREIRNFGSNPGNLDLKLFAPPVTRARRPLVVVLHGCTQTVETFARASGWARIAAAQDVLLLMPAQRRENNYKTCFSWFEPEDTRRDSGEVLSIRQMIARVVADHKVDDARIFVCGLSAGGAMAGAMLATYPEVFAGGAIIAGLPYGAASNISEAMDSMRSGRVREARAWGDAVREASPGPRRWPAVSIWQGTADTVVKPINAGELIKQWTNVHDVGAEVPAETHIGPTTQRTWFDRRGRACVTEYSVPGLGHGAPVDDADPPAPFFLPAGLSSAARIAADWGLSTPTRRLSLASLGALLRS